MSYYLIREIEVQNANALSSPFTYGFPAVTAFAGFAHALNSKITGVGIISHRFEMQDYSGKYGRTLKLTANPLLSNGERPSMVEEGRCHFTVSLIVELDEGLPVQGSEILRMKLAGGDILRYKGVEPMGDIHALRRVVNGYALRSVESEGDLIDALVTLHQFADGEWVTTRPSQWLVPVATGFKRISPLAVGVRGSRDLT